MSSPYPHEDRGPSLVGTEWTECTIVILIVAFRFYARISIKALGIDDWLMLLAVILFIVQVSFSTYLASIGAFRHWDDVSPSDKLAVVFWQNPLETIGVLGYIPSKCSVAWQILRIMSLNMVWRKRILYVLMATIIVFNILDVIFIWAQCQPAEALWNPLISGHCWEPTVLVIYSQFVSVWNIVCDTVLALLPATIIYKLQIAKRRRIELSVLMGFGLLATVCGSIKASYMPNISVNSDFSWLLYPINLWAISENFVVIVCGSIPPLRSLFDKLVGKGRRSAYSYVGYRGNTVVYDNLTSSMPLRNHGGQSKSAGTMCSKNKASQTPMVIEKTSAWNVEVVSRESWGNGTEPPLSDRS